MNRLLLILLVVSSTSCATTRYAHTTKGSREMKQDWINCRTKMGQARVTGYIWQERFLQECMEGEGWQRISQQERKSPSENAWAEIEPQVGRLALGGILKWEEQEYREYRLGGLESPLERAVRLSQGFEP